MDFFNLKIEWLKWFVGPKNAFQNTFLDVLSAPYTICPYLKKNLGPKNFGILGVRGGQNTVFFKAEIFF